MKAAEDIAIQRVVREACVLGGAGRAILLQVAHPKVAQGVAEHSRFAENPLKRLRGTLDYVYGVTLGTPEESEWVAGAVNRIHTYVKGAGYSANDPELQLWVAATLYDTSLHLYEAMFGPMSTAMRDEFCREAARYGTLLGCPEDLWPGSAAEFEEYWDRTVASLEISEDAKRICRDLLYNHAIPWYLLPLLPVNRLITTGLLPERLRNELGLAWDPRRERMFRSAARAAQFVYPRVPKPVRNLPVTLYLQYFHRRFRAHA